MLEVKDLHAYYGKSHILQGVDLNIAAGEVVSLLGRNGVGRSTTVKAIMGEVPPQGTIRFKGQDIAGMPSHKIARRGLGYVPEHRDIFPGLTVRQKFVAQMVLALVLAVWLYRIQRAQPAGLQLVSPFGRWSAPLGAGFMLWAALLMVGSSNGVNLTDGLDGLAGGCLVFAGSAFTALTYLAGHRVMAEYLALPHMPGAGELSVLCGAMVGAISHVIASRLHARMISPGTCRAVRATAPRVGGCAAPVGIPLRWLELGDWRKR